MKGSRRGWLFSLTWVAISAITLFGSRPDRFTAAMIVLSTSD